MNYTIIVPAGTSNHGKTNLLCVPPSWHDYITFFLGNYLIHAATVGSKPGATLTEVIFTAANALFIPGVGALAAVRKLNRHAAWPRNNDLRQAVKAGAIGMVVRSQRIQQARPMKGKVTSEIYDAIHGGPECPPSWFKFANPIRATLLPRNRKFHGICKLPRDYCLVEVPENVPLKPYRRTPDQTTDIQLHDIQLASSYSFPNALIATAQGLIGIVTLYKTQGDQISRYGYAAFGLTVVPYLFMSLVNLATAIVTPQYSCMYMAHTPDMDDAIQEGGSFTEVIASVDMDAVDEPIEFVSLKLAVRDGCLTLLMIITPLVIVGALSRFQNGDQSSTAQRAWIMSWLCVGLFSSPFIIVLSKNLAFASYFSDLSIFLYVVVALLAIPLWIPPIGGMVTVGKMITEYGVCTKLDF